MLKEFIAAIRISLAMLYSVCLCLALTPRDLCTLMNTQTYIRAYRKVTNLLSEFVLARNISQVYSLLLSIFLLLISYCHTVNVLMIKRKNCILSRNCLLNQLWCFDRSSILTVKQEVLIFVTGNWIQWSVWTNIRIVWICLFECCNLFLKLIFPGPPKIMIPSVKFGQNLKDFFKNLEMLPFHKFLSLRKV